MSQAAPYLFQEELYTIPGNLLVIINRPWEEVSDDERALLTKILGSVRVSIGGVSIISKDPVALETLAAFDPSRVLIFGSSDNKDLKFYEYTDLNGVGVIKAHDIGELDDARKKSLWQAMRKMFGV